MDHLILPPCPNRLLPTRECYGHALFSAKRFQEAEKIFRQSLVKDSFHAEPKLEMLKGKGCFFWTATGRLCLLLCMFFSRFFFMMFDQIQVTVIRQ